MGSPSASQLQTITDLQAARMRQDIAGYQAEYGSQANPSLYNTVKGYTDPDVVTALLSGSLALDRRALPENLPTLCGARVWSDQLYQSWLTSLETLVKSSAGGGYASLAAYLTGKSALLHPLYAEFVRAQRGGDAAVPVANCFAPTYAAIAPVRAYHGADGSLTDITAVAGGTGTATLFDTNGKSLYLLSPYKFRRCVIATSTPASSGLTYSVSVWDGTAFTAVSGLTDSSAGLTKQRQLSWTLPAEMEPTCLDAGGTVFPGPDYTPYYCYKITRTSSGALGTAPVLSAITLAPEPVLANGAHYGVAQGPLALCEITAANTLLVTPLNTVAFARFAPQNVRLRAATAIAQDLTVTLAYTNQGNNDGTAGSAKTQSQGSWTAPSALGTKSGTLYSGDTGVQAISNTTAVVTTATDGAFWIEAIETRVPTK